jgi:hypothetical protein
MLEEGEVGAGGGEGGGEVALAEVNKYSDLMNGIRVEVN